MAALPRQPLSREVFGKSVLYGLAYRGPGVRGSRAIGMPFFGPPMVRAGKIWIAEIPHAGRAAAAHLALHPDHRIMDGADGWTVPEGLVEISRAERDLVLAEHRLRAERGKAA
jgi:hypothetical protein